MTINTMNIRSENTITNDKYTAVMYIHAKDNIRIFNNYEGKSLEFINDKNNKNFNRHFDRHYHKELEINYIIDGKCDYYIDGNHYPAESGDIIIINSDSIHTIVVHRLDCIQDITALTLLIDDKLVKNIVQDFDNYFFDIDGLDNLTKLKLCIQKLLYVYINDNTSSRNIGITGLIYELFYELCTSNAKKVKSESFIKQRVDSNRIKEILNYVSNNYNKQLKQQEVAKQFYLSREYFSRYFKQTTGFTFKEYLILYRLKIAKEKIINSDDTMTNIALDTGFSDNRQFISYFKKYYNITPYQYKKKICKY